MVAATETKGISISDRNMQSWMSWPFSIKRFRTFPIGPRQVGQKDSFALQRSRADLVSDENISVVILPASFANHVSTLALEKWWNSKVKTHCKKSLGVMLDRMGIPNYKPGHSKTLSKVSSFFMPSPPPTPARLWAAVARSEAWSSICLVGKTFWPDAKALSGGLCPERKRKQKDVTQVQNAKCFNS